MAKISLIVIGLFFVLNLTFFPLSAGTRYYNHLQKWYYLALRNDWTHAQQLEKILDPADIVVYKTRYYPPEIKKRLNALTLKNPKTAFDYMEISRIYAQLGQKDQALLALSQAHNLDPIQPEIEKLYFELVR